MEDARAGREERWAGGVWDVPKEEGGREVSESRGGNRNGPSRQLEAPESSSGKVMEPVCSCAGGVSLPLGCLEQSARPSPPPSRGLRPNKPTMTQHFTPSWFSWTADVREGSASATTPPLVWRVTAPPHQLLFLPMYVTEDASLRGSGCPRPSCYDSVPLSLFYLDHSTSCN